ncbi:MAG: serine/threonine protein kinase [Deltaproteobacteria bacterium]|nr:serine/threonine protein kinase [Deltaproteobacteria bacterium]
MSDPTGTPLGKLLDLHGAELEHANRYLVSQVVGEGGMAKVLHAWDAHLRRNVAVKVMTSATGDDDRKRFNREARVLASLRHPGVVQLVDYSGPDAQRQYLVMELLEGQTLTVHVARKPLPEPALTALAYLLIEALRPAHESGIVHRDIKPDNVFLEPGGRVVLIDFGLAKGTLLTAKRNTFLAGATKMLGTPEYSCPEVLASAPLVVQSDFFSLGSTLYFAATGAPPFQSEKILELVNMIVSKPHVPLAQKGFGAELSAVIDAMLQKGPDDRPASAKALLAMLEPLLKRTGNISPQQAIAEYLGTANDTVITRAPPTRVGGKEEIGQVPRPGATATDGPAIASRVGPALIGAGVGFADGDLTALMAAKH